MTIENFKAFQPALPNQPGVYRFIDANATVLYVGKAKNLRNRVTSYFVGLDDKIARLKLLVKNADRIEFTIVNSERDALLLENELIKTHQPKYNIQLKDGKSYPYICISNEPFPKVFVARKLVRDGTKYFGPYPSSGAVYTILDLVQKLYRIRSCSLNLSAKNIAEKKFRVCLEYHIGNCYGPCVGAQSEEDYDNNIQQIKAILKGNTGAVIQELTLQLNQFAAKWEFEKAAEIQKKISALQSFKEKSTLVHPEITNVDVYSLVCEKELAFVNFMRVVNGSVVQTQTIELKFNLDESKEQLLAFAIQHFNREFGEESSEIIIPFSITETSPGITYTIPSRGDKKNLLDLSLKNSIYYKNKRLAADESFKIKTEEFAVLKELQREFRLTELPLHIECFDNSNFQGDYPVSAMVVFKNGKTSKKDYRHFNIKTVEGPNDFASMEEVIERRYSRLIAEAASLPQLILIDGGKGQLSSAFGVIEKLGLRGRVAIASIAKKLEEIYVPNDSVPLHISKKSPALKLIQFLRDEAHRFGITHHRNRRDKATLMPELMKIKGIGESANMQLLKTFKSVSNVKKASLQELIDCVGTSKAQIILNHFNPTATDTN